VSRLGPCGELFLGAPSGSLLLPGLCQGLHGQTEHHQGDAEYQLNAPRGGRIHGRIDDIAENRGTGEQHQAQQQIEAGHGSQEQDNASWPQSTGGEHQPQGDEQGAETGAVHQRQNDQRRQELNVDLSSPSAIEVAPSQSNRLPRILIHPS